MSQFDFGNLSSPVSGSALIDGILEPWRDALHSMHGGTVRPSYAVPGLLWRDTTTTPWALRMFDGADDILIGYVNATTNSFDVAGGTLNNLIATVAPTTHDDVGDGYAPGSMWVDLTGDNVYFCVDASSGAAVWYQPVSTTKAQGMANKAITASTFGGTLNNGVVATTQGANDNSLKVATTAYVDAAVAAGSDSVAAWVNFNGTGTVAIRAQKNVSSITDLGVGTYRVNFTTALPDANYSAVAGCDGVGPDYSHATASSYATTSVVVRTGITAYGIIDDAFISLVVCR